MDIKRELILVAGSPGVGKSYLVTKGLKEPAEKRGIVFASGKFDLNSYSFHTRHLHKHALAKQSDVIFQCIQDQVGYT